MASGTLHGLPTEILHHIFNYCDSKTVFLSVRYVCKRLKAVTELSNRVELNEKYETRDDSQSIRRLIHPSTIHSLTVLDDTFYWGSTSREDISFINIQKFSQLRSLTFRGIDAEKLKSLLPSLEMHLLNSLSIIIDGWNSDILLTLFMLAVLHLNPRRLFLKSNETMTNFSFSVIDCKLEYLRINKCDQLGFVSILRQFPSLQACVIDEYKMNTGNKLVPSLVDLSLSSRLKSLTIKNYSLPVKILALLLTLTPSLVYLSLKSETDTFDRIFDGLYWEELISSKLRSLETFEFFFLYRVSKDAHFLDIDPSISSFQSKFWLNEKNWIVKCAYIIGSSEFWLYTNKFRIERYKDSSECEISSMDDVWRFSERSSDQTDATTKSEVRPSEIRRVLPCE